MEAFGGTGDFSAPVPETRKPKLVSGRRHEREEATRHRTATAVSMSLGVTALPSTAVRWQGSSCNKCWPEMYGERRAEVKSRCVDVQMWIWTYRVGE